MRHTCLLLLLLLPLSACERRELTYYTESEISVTADWSHSGLEAEKNYGATLIVYPQEGGEPYIELMGDRGSATLRLALGKYDAVIFNRSFDDFGALGFRDWQTPETFEAYARKVETRATTRVIVASPERLAAETVLGFEVTEDMLGNYAPAVSRANGNADCPQEKCRLRFTPLPLTREVVVTIDVKGLNNVRQARCVLQGVPLSILVYNGQSGGEVGGQEFAVGSPAFTPGSLTEGTLTGTINTFGLRTDGNYGAELEALLVDGVTVVKQTLTGLVVTEGTDATGNTALYLRAVAPDPFPDVKPEGSTDPGFDAEVGDWEKEENADITI